MSLLPRTGKIIGPDTRYIEVNPITQELLIYTTLESCHLKDKNKCDVIRFSFILCIMES